MLGKKGQQGQIMCIYWHVERTQHNLQLHFFKIVKYQRSFDFTYFTVASTKVTTMPCPFDCTATIQLCILTNSPHMYIFYAD